MKKLILTTLTIVGFLLVFAQQIPDFKNQPMLLNEDGSLSKLEKQVSEMKVKAKAMGYGGASSYINLIPANSPVSLSDNTPEFVIKVDDDIDPETVFYLTKCAVNSKNRQIEMMRTSAFAAYGAGGKSTKKEIVALEYSKIGENVYKMTVTEALEPGEYAFVNASQGSGSAGAAGSTVVFSFGVK